MKNTNKCKRGYNIGENGVCCSVCDDEEQEELDRMAKQQFERYITKNSDNKDIHPNSLKAIVPYQFKKGQSGNVNGRPLKNTNLAKDLSIIGNEVDDDVFNEGNKTNRERVMQEVWKLAKLGDKDMIKLLVHIGGLE